MIRDKRSQDGTVALRDDQTIPNQAAALRARHRRFFRGRQRRELQSEKAEGLDERAKDLTDEIDSPSSADEDNPTLSATRAGFYPTTRQTISSTTAVPAPTLISSSSSAVIMPTLTLNPAVASTSPVPVSASTILSTAAIVAPAPVAPAVPAVQSSLPSTLTTAVIAGPAVQPSSVATTLTTAAIAGPAAQLSQISSSPTLSFTAAPVQNSLLSSVAAASSVTGFLTSTTAAFGFPLITPGSITQDATRTEAAKKESSVPGGLIVGIFIALVAMIAVFVMFAIAAKKKPKEEEAHKGDAEKHGPPGSANTTPPTTAPPSTAPPTAPPSAMGNYRNTTFTPPPYWPTPSGSSDPSMQKPPISTGTSTPNPAFTPSQLPLVPAPLQNGGGAGAYFDPSMQKGPNQNGGGQAGYFDQAMQKPPAPTYQQAPMYRPAPPPPTQGQPAGTRDLTAQTPPAPAGEQFNPNMQQGAPNATLPRAEYAPYRPPFVESVTPEQNQPQQQQRQDYGGPGPAYLAPNQDQYGQGQRGPNYPRESNFSISRYLDEDRPPLPQTTYMPR